MEEGHSSGGREGGEHLNLLDLNDTQAQAHAAIQLDSRECVVAYGLVEGNAQKILCEEETE